MELLGLLAARLARGVRSPTTGSPVGTPSRHVLHAIYHGGHRECVGDHADLRTSGNDGHGDLVARSPHEGSVLVGPHLFVSAPHYDGDRFTDPSECGGQAERRLKASR